jgi:hypothetical protein
MCDPASRDRPSLGNASPEATTGVPNKYYRGPQQESPSASRPLTPLRRANKPKARPIRPRETPPATYRGAQQVLPGSPTRVTGVSNKNYRGAQQVLPGSPTKATGVSNKNYRGAQQVLPGRPTKTTGVSNKWHFLELLQNEVFCVVFRGSFVFVYLVVLCC